MPRASIVTLPPTCAVLKRSFGVLQRFHRSFGHNRHEDQPTTSPGMKHGPRTDGSTFVSVHPRCTRKGRAERLDHSHPQKSRRQPHRACPLPLTVQEPAAARSPRPLPPSIISPSAIPLLSIIWIDTVTDKHCEAVSGPSDKTALFKASKPMPGFPRQKSGFVLGRQLAV